MGTPYPLEKKNQILGRILSKEITVEQAHREYSIATSDCVSDRRMIGCRTWVWASAAFLMRLMAMSSSSKASVVTQTDVGALSSIAPPYDCVTLKSCRAW